MNVPSKVADPQPHVDAAADPRGGGWGRNIHCPLNPQNGWNHMSAKPPEEGPTAASTGGGVTTDKNVWNIGEEIASDSREINQELISD